MAIGECGLDFNRNFSPQETQLEVFEKQVQLACELKKPLFLHERDAHDDMVRILCKYKDRLPPAVLHCFTGNSAQALKYIEMGLYIGLTGMVLSSLLFRICNDPSYILKGSCGRTKLTTVLDRF